MENDDRSGAFTLEAGMVQFFGPEETAELVALAEVKRLGLDDENEFQESNTDSNRKLAYIEVIDKLSPIENADSIELAEVSGWKCVVTKGQFKEGDVGVFFEIDAILPDGPHWAEFMRPRGFRVKTVKLRGQVSQGLMIPVASFADRDLEIYSCVEDKESVRGTDLTKTLGVSKYEIPVNNSGGNNLKCGRSKGNFPGFLHKTDEIRVQNLAKALEKHKGKMFYWSEKYDGSSFTAYLNRASEGGRFGVCSRNLELDVESGGGDFCALAASLDIEGKLRSLGRNLAIQGEMIGPGIQGNKYKLAEKQLHIFNVFDIDNDQYLDIDDAKNLVESLGLTFVYTSEPFELNHTVDELVEMAKGRSALNENTHREGIVLRPVVEEYCGILKGRLSFKSINPNFLLKYDA